MQLTLVRHGETIENHNNIIQGQMPGQLSDLGKQQALQVADKLKAEHFDAIYCSDLQRCLDTLKPIKSFHPTTPTTITEQLRERYCSDSQGKTFDRDYWQSLPGDETIRHYEGGESWEDVKQRIRPFLNELLQKHPNGQVLLVAHGGVVRGIRSWIEDKPLIDIMKEPNPNAGIWNETLTKSLKEPADCAG